MTLTIDEFDVRVRTLLDKQKAMARWLRVGAVMLALMVITIIGLILYLQMRLLDQTQDAGVKIPDSEVIRIIREANVVSSACAEKPGMQTLTQLTGCVDRLTTTERPH